MERNQIFIVSGTEYKEMTKRLLSVCRLAERIPSKESLIGIKPNLVSPSPAEQGATTHPEIIAGIIEYLKENGFLRLVILESSWVGAKTADALRVCAYDDLCAEYDVPFRDMQKEKGIKKNCGGMEISICRFVSELDFLINVPVVKGHCQTKITCALKNMKGLIPGSEKRRFHSLGLHKPIAHLNAGIRQDFIVVDNICGDLDFEDGGNPVVMNRILAALDPVLLDSFICRMLHYETGDVPYIRMAEALGIGSSELSRADIRTADGADAPELSLKRPEKVVEVQDHVEEVESCSACYGYLIPALVRLKEEGLLDQLAHKICIGQGCRGKSGELGIGHCTKGFSRHLEGCPPTEEQIYSFLKNEIQRREEETSV